MDKAKKQALRNTAKFVLSIFGASVLINVVIQYFGIATAFILMMFLIFGWGIRLIYDYELTLAKFNEKKDDE